MDGSRAGMWSLGVVSKIYSLGSREQGEAGIDSQAGSCIKSVLLESVCLERCGDGSQKNTVADGGRRK